MLRIELGTFCIVLLAAMNHPAMKEETNKNELIGAIGAGTDLKGFTVQIQINGSPFGLFSTSCGQIRECQIRIGSYDLQFSQNELFSNVSF